MFSAKKLLILLTLCAMALTLLAGCNKNIAETSSQDVSTTISEEESQGHEDVAPEVKDLEGRVINVLCWDWSAGSASILGYTGEIISNNEIDPSRVDIAKAAVIDAVEAEYKVTISGLVTNKGSFSSDVKNMVTSGIYEYDIIFTGAGGGADFAMNGALTDLNTINTINLSNSWWDQNCVKDVSIHNRLFWVCGDINTYDNLGTWCVLFNKNLKDDLGIADDFYQKAKDGDWTMDYFMEICQGVTRDLNGDGQDEFDQWACGTETFNIFAQVVGGGIHAVSKDDSDTPYLTVDDATERTYAALDKIITFYNGGEVMVANGGKYDGKGYSNVWEATVHKAFIEGRELFYICGLINVAGFRSMDNEFGILPMPKTFAEQDTYYHTVSPGNSSYMMIPYGVPNVEDLGLVIEALAMKSQESVTPEFYDQQLKGRDTRDSESADMLDIIFATRSFDLAPVFDWGSIMTCYKIMDTNYASRFETYSDAARMAIEDCLDIWDAYVEAE